MERMTTSSILIHTGVNFLLSRQDLMFAFTIFLSLHDLCQWDRAFTNTGMRESWLSLVKDVICMSGPCYISLKESDGLKVQWLINRHIHPSGSGISFSINWGSFSINSVQRDPRALTPELVAVFALQSKLRFLDISFHNYTSDEPDKSFEKNFVQGLCDSLESHNTLSAIIALKVIHMGCLSSVQLEVLTKFCPQLDRLEVCLSSGDSIKYLKNCPALRTLYLHLDMCEFVTRGMEHLVVNCLELQCLVFSKASALTDLDLEVLAGGCKKLKKLSLPHNVSAAGSAHLIEACHDSLEFIISSLPISNTIFGLLTTCLKLRYVQFTEGNVGKENEVENYVSDAVLIAFSESCQSLQVIRLLSRHHFCPRIRIALGMHCPGLLSICLNEGRSIDDAALNIISKSCPNLRHIHLNHSPVTDEGVRRLLDDCPRLSRVFLGSCLHVTNLAYRLLAESLSMVSLNVYGCPRIDDNSTPYKYLGLIEPDCIPVFHDYDDYII